MNQNLFSSSNVSSNNFNWIMDYTAAYNNTMPLIPVYNNYNNNHHNINENSHHHQQQQHHPHHIDYDNIDNNNNNLDKAGTHPTTQSMDYYMRTISPYDNNNNTTTTTTNAINSKFHNRLSHFEPSIHHQYDIHSHHHFQTFNQSYHADYHHHHNTNSNSGNIYHTNHHNHITSPLLPNDQENLKLLKYNTFLGYHYGTIRNHTSLNDCSPTDENLNGDCHEESSNKNNEVPNVAHNNNTPHNEAAAHVIEPTANASKINNNHFNNKNFAIEYYRAKQLKHCYNSVNCSENINIINNVNNNNNSDMKPKLNNDINIDHKSKTSSPKTEDLSTLSTTKVDSNSCDDKVSPANHNIIDGNNNNINNNSPSKKYITTSTTSPNNSIQNLNNYFHLNNVTSFKDQRHIDKNNSNKQQHHYNPNILDYNDDSIKNCLPKHHWLDSNFKFIVFIVLAAERYFVAKSAASEMRGVARVREMSRDDEDGDEDDEDRKASACKGSDSDNTGHCIIASSLRHSYSISMI
ncbi:hypothetical protein HELRODRAFT_183524 [Helobdella robusta]|uniref:Uncharacterized protein n=1 Tax=Helobdella robusta TaxID=6412 RepID=T1FJS4_HELRO|nr:hypothetical protein HELRODRAFT_183524 [Helobdella robusta]ESO10494.1 hypothetical protein HELRODRAFT_183524 [Helobdella robusta]